MPRFFHHSQKIFSPTLSLCLCCLFAFTLNITQAKAQNNTTINSATPQSIVATAPQSSLKLEPSPWHNLEPGLDYASFALQGKGQNAGKTIGQLEVLRFSPQFFCFNLYAISENNTAPQTLQQWAQNHNLVAAINASMYLPDGKTSTGYMRKDGHINNKRIAKAFGVFFLAEPNTADLPVATLIEKSSPQFKSTLAQYKTVIQNFRLLSAEGEILWSERGQKHSIAAVGMDKKGNILFLHCRQPIDAHILAIELLRLPLQLGPVMYVEGGAQAGMVLRHESKNTFWGGRHPADFFMGSVGVALPNILGVQRKKTLK